jgi:Rrf2 family protein
MNNLLNISEGTSLAFHGLALIAERTPGRLSVKALAGDLRASEAHLAKVFQKLNKAGIVSSFRGPTGGFVLNKPAGEISFLDVYEILESPVLLNNCPLGKSMCSMHRCIFEGKIQGISRDIYEALQKIKLSDFEKNGM